MSNTIFKLIGFLFVGIGAAGIFLPVVPTTGPLLFAAWCFARSSKRFHDWLVNHRLFGRYIRSFIRYHAISLKGKILSIGMMWTMIGISAYFFVDSLALRLILLAAAIGGTIWIVSYPTLKSSTLDRSCGKALNEKTLEADEKQDYRHKRND